MAADKETREIEIILNGQKVNASLKEMNAAAALMNNQLRKMGSDDPGRAKLIKDLQTQRDRIADTRQELYGVEKASFAAKLGLNGITSASGLMRAGFQAAVAAFLPLLALQTIVDLGRSFLGLVNHIDQVKGSLQQLTGAQGEALDQMYVRVQAISKTFEEDHNEVIKSANVLMKEFGLSNKEAFDLIEKGYLAGANSSGEMLEQIKEYSTQFAASGATAEEFFGILVKGEKAGIFSDKAADTVKEFGLRIREQTKATGEALDAAFGQGFTDKVFEGINNGSMTTMEALRLVSKEMNNTQIPANELQTVIADVFGGPGEDAGLAFLQSLHEVNGGLEGMIDSTNTLTSAQADQLEAEKLLAEAQAELGASFSGTGATLNWLWTMIQTVGLKSLTILIEAVRKVRDEIVGFGFIFAEVWQSVSNGWKALTSGDFSGVADAFRGLGGRIEKAFVDGRLHYRMQALEDEKKLQQQETDQRIKDEKAKQKAIDEATRAEKKKAADQAAKEAEQQRKKEESALKKATEEYKKAKVTSEQEVTKLKIELMEEGVDKVLAKLRYQHEQEKAELEKRKADILANTAATEEEKQALIDQYNEQRRMKEEALKLAEEEAKIADKEKKQEEYFTQLEEEEEYQALAMEEQFLRTFDAEAAREQALLELHKQTLEQKLAYLQESGLGQTAEALRINNELLKIERDKTDKAKAMAEERTKFESQMTDMRLNMLTDAFEGVMDLMDKESTAFQALKHLRKVLAIAEIAINLQKELSLNAVAAAGMGPFGAAYLPLSNAKSLLRAGLATAKVVAFEKGGMTKGDKTVPMSQVGGVWQMASGLTGGSSIGTFAKGGWVNDAQLGLIGEAGRELVIPNWMVESPKYANLVGYLEAERQRGVRAFADGGMTAGGAPALPTIQQDDRLVQKFDELLQKVDTLNSKVEAWPTRLEVHNNVGDTRDKLQVLNDLERRAFG
ncbi:phage tail tape measure protein [Pontibacter kalidii]|uniref:phage tail tape measure protein n=1 Tax=Pontibacter kalidii TaxID=2592049 RepID=UPI00225ADD29|nr:phage tail tape measure protein [Pontibacter kalidii]